MIDFLVIGSGPTGVAAARKLISLGQSVLLLDVGDQLDKLRSNTLEYLSTRKYSEWTRAEKNKYSSLLTPDARVTSHAGSKLSFGSFYPYADFSRLSNSEFSVVSNVPSHPSLSIGGLSNVWGSIVFPYTNRDLSLLDYRIEDRHYDFIASFVPISGLQDELEQIYYRSGFPLGQVQFSNLNLRLKKLTAKLSERFEFRVNCGSPRVAVHSNGLLACQSCGLCATGCVWDSIWSSRQEIPWLKKSNLFEYQSNIMVEKIVDQEDSVSVLDTKGREWKARKVFVAAGALSTASLLHKSKLVPEVVNISDTQLTLIPCIAPGLKQTSNNFVLSQFIVNLPDQTGVTDFFIQITGFNEDLYRRSRGLMPILKFVPKLLLNFIFSRLAIAMVFQKSSKSGTVRVARNDSTIQFESKSESLLALTKIPEFKKVIKVLRKLRLFPVLKLSQSVGIGESYHLGNLRNQDGEFLFDLDGRPIGTRNIHVVDTSSLSYIAPGPITFTAMANAVRIAERVVLST